MIKRLFDIVLSAAGLILLFLPMALLSAIIWRASGRPIFFVQSRVGLRGREFKLVKFRSMRETYDELGQLLPDNERVTRIGRFLRRTRIDELPELWLILRGDMSFVGPRPLPLTVLPGGSVAAMRARVRPGLTGLAQVSGNTLLTNTEKFAIDLLYAADPNVLTDFRILLKTLIVIAKGEDRDTPLIKRALVYAAHPDRRGW